MIAVVFILLAFFFIQNVMQCKRDWTPVLGTWEIPDYAWEAAQPLPPADDTHLKTHTIRFLEPTLEDVEACALDALERMRTSNNLFTAYINGEYEPPVLPPDIGWDEVFSISPLTLSEIRA